MAANNQIYRLFKGNWFLVLPSLKLALLFISLLLEFALNALRQRPSLLGHYHPELLGGLLLIRVLDAPSFCDWAHLHSPSQDV